MITLEQGEEFIKVCNKDTKKTQTANKQGHSIFFVDSDYTNVHVGIRG